MGGALTRGPQNVPMVLFPQRAPARRAGEAWRDPERLAAFGSSQKGSLVKGGLAIIIQ